MAVLVGTDTTTANQAHINPGYLYMSGFTAGSAGTATTIKLRTFLASGQNIKLACYNATGARLDITAPIAGADYSIISGSINCSINASERYYLGFIFDANEISTYGDGTDWNTKQDSSANYTTPPTSVSAWTDGDGDTVGGKLAIWVEGTTGATLTQEGYRWRLDDANEAAATWAANQDTGITAPANAVRRLRVLVDTTGDANAAAYRLEYKEANDANYTAIT